MKVDVVVNYYRRMKEWPFVLRGLQDNIDYINDVIVSNDEYWSEENIVTFPNKPLILLDHDHDGPGMARCVNDGLRTATTDHVLLIDDDIVLAPHAIEQTVEHAEDEGMVGGTIHDVPRVDELTLGEDLSKRVLREGWRGGHDPWHAVRKGFLLLHRETALRLGGMNDEIKGYGGRDYELALKWFLATDPEAFVLGKGIGYHMGGIDRPEDKSWKQMNPKMIARLQYLESKYRAKYG